MHGQSFSADSNACWESTLEVARELALELYEDLMIYLSKDSL